MPQSQLIAHARGRERTESLNECDGPCQLASGQQTSLDSGSGWSSQAEDRYRELLALAQLPRSQLLASEPGDGTASQWGAASQEGPDPQLLELAAQPLSQLLRPGT